MYSNLFRVGKDTELRYTPAGKAVCNVALAYDVGYGDNKKTGWIEGVLWDKRAEALVQYLLKGTQHFVVIDDLEVETFTKGNGEHGAKLKGRIVDLKLGSNGANTLSSQGYADNQSQAAKPEADNQSGGFDMDGDDIPF